MKHRRAARIDVNQPGIVRALKKIPGVAVEIDHDDIFVGFKGVNYWFELKEPGAVSKKTGHICESKKQKSQKELEKTWPGHYRIVWNIDQILNEMGISQ